MLAPNHIITTWRKFDHFPMETLTKAWFYQKGTNKKQRSVSLMKEHREEYGITGNCFDLAIWLLNEFKKDGITAYPIGQHFKTERAHVAVVALDEEGKRYLCDLGDQWLNPILIDSDSEDYTDEMLSGFFPAAKVQVKSTKHEVEVHYHRPNGKMSQQRYDVTPLDETLFLEAAEFSQHLIKPRPLLECRVPYKTETAHWEFCNWESFLSTSEGLFHDKNVTTIEEWAERIHSKTGYHKQLLTDALHLYMAKA